MFAKEHSSVGSDVNGESADTSTDIDALIESLASISRTRHYKAATSGSCSNSTTSGEEQRETCARVANYANLYNSANVCNKACTNVPGASTPTSSGITDVDPTHARVADHGSKHDSLSNSSEVSFEAEVGSVSVAEQEEELRRSSEKRPRSPTPDADPAAKRVVIEKKSEIVRSEISNAPGGSANTSLDDGMTNMCATFAPAVSVSSADSIISISFCGHTELTTPGKDVGSLSSGSNAGDNSGVSSSRPLDVIVQKIAANISSNNGESSSNSVDVVAHNSGPKSQENLEVTKPNGDSLTHILAQLGEVARSDASADAKKQIEQIFIAKLTRIVQ